MSGVVMEQQLYCKHCRAVKEHHTQWDSGDPKRVYAQCAHHGPRLISYLEPADVRRIGKYIYQFA